MGNHINSYCCTCFISAIDVAEKPVESLAVFVAEFLLGRGLEICAHVLLGFISAQLVIL